jgi:hypothetical protein
MSDAVQAIGDVFAKTDKVVGDAIGNLAEKYMQHYVDKLGPEQQKAIDHAGADQTAVPVTAGPTQDTDEKYDAETVVGVGKTGLVVGAASILIIVLAYKAFTK